MARLYELVADMKEAEQLLYEAGADEETIKETLDSLSLGIDEKLTNYAAMYKNLQADIEVFKAEENRIKNQRKVMENRLKWLKEEIDAAMKLAGKEELKNGTHSISYRKGSEVVEIDEKELPKEYFIRPDPVPMGKNELKKLIKEGKEIKGVKIVRKPDTVQIK